MVKEKQEDQKQTEIESLEEALSSEADSRVPFSLAESFRLQGRYEEAIESCRKGLEKMPDFLAGRLLLGRCYYEKGQFKQAREELEKVVKEIEEYIPAYKWLGQIYLQGKEVDKALEVMRKELFLTTSSEISKKEITPLEIGFLTRGKPPFSTPRIDPIKKPQEDLKTEKNEEFKKSIQTDTLAEIYLKQGHLEKALSIYQEILGRDPGNTHVREKFEEVEKKIQADQGKKSRQKLINHLERWLSRATSKGI